MLVMRDGFFTSIDPFKYSQGQVESPIEHVLHSCAGQLRRAGSLFEHATIPELEVPRAAAEEVSALAAKSVSTPGMGAPCTQLQLLM